MLGCWADGTNESSTKRLMFQVLFFFMISCKILCKNPFNLFSYFFYKITKIKIKSFECPKSIKSIKKNNTWNIRCLVNKSFVPATQRTNIVYWRFLLNHFTRARHQQFKCYSKRYIALLCYFKYCHLNGSAHRGV